MDRPPVTQDAERPADAPLVSIIIVTFNSAGVIGACLRSLDETRDEIATEVIVVDNGSRDRTLEVVAPSYPDARILHPGTNLGFGRANNFGAKEARGEHLWILNPDTVVRPGALRSLVATLDASPDACAAGPRLVDADGAEAMTFGDFPTLGWALATLAPAHRLGISSSTRLRRDLPEGAEPFDVDYACGAALLVRRECWERVGGFDPDFFLYFEDTDLCLRLHRSGGRVLVDPGAEVVHLEGTTLAGAAPASSAYFHEGLLVFLRRDRGWASAAVARVWLAMASTLYLVTGAVLGRRFPGVRSNRHVHQALLHLALWGKVARPA